MFSIATPGQPDNARAFPPDRNWLIFRAGDCSASPPGALRARGARAGVMLRSITIGGRFGPVGIGTHLVGGRR